MAIFPCGRTIAPEKKKAGLRRMFFSSLRDYAPTNVMMASRSQNGHCRIELER